MRVYEDICDMLHAELEQIAQKRELTSSALEIMDKAVDIVKDIKTIEAMEKSGYSERYMYGDTMGYGYDTGNNYSNASYNRKRDSMGRYSRDTQITSQLQQMMSNAQSEQEKEMIRKWMGEVR